MGGTMTERPDKDVKEAKKVPLYGFFTTYESAIANQLIASNEWICSMVTERGKYVLKRIR